MIFFFVLRLGLSCHGILQARFFSVFKKVEDKSKRSRDSASDVLSMVFPGSSCVDLVKNEQESPFTFPDVPVAKIQGVRAAKSESWLKRTETISEIASAIMSTEPVFRLSTWFLQQQEEQTWLSDNPSNRPIVNLVTPRFSPVVKAIASCFDMLVNPGSDDGPLQFLDGNLECGKDQWWCCVHS